MFSKNNRRMLLSKTSETTKTYALKKLSIGIVSVAVGSFIFVGQADQVLAEEANTESVETVIAPEESEPVASTTAVDEPVTPEEVTEPVAADPAEVAPEATQEPSNTAAAAQQEETPKSTVEIEEGEHGSRALDHIKELSEEIGQRVAGTDVERETADYIKGQFEEMGYDVSEQPFEFTQRNSDQTLNSQNIIAVKHHENPRQLIIGAHYDSVTSGGSLGAADNASGVGVMLEVAERIFAQQLNYTVKFIAFGAEEVGLRGARHYTSQMTEEEIARTIAMVNLDTLLGGDYMYIYSGANSDHVWLREFMFEINDELFDFPIRTNPGLNEDYPAGTTGDWSDHAPFNALGIPIVYLESTNWEIGDFDGYIQSEEFGPIMHTGRDSLYFIENNFPGQIEENLMSFVSLLEATVLGIAVLEAPPVEDDDDLPVDEQPGEESPDDDIENDGSGVGELPGDDDRDPVVELVVDNTEDSKEEFHTMLAEAEEEEKEEYLPDTATSTWALGLLGVSLVIGGAGIGKKRQ